MPMLNPPRLWPICPACASVINSHSDAGARAVLLGQLLGELLAVDDLAAVRAAARLPLARDVPKLGQPATVRMPFAPRAIGDEPVSLEDRKPPTQPAGAGSATRWQFVSNEQRDELREALARERRRERPRRHSGGPCAYCGCAEALRWHSPVQVSTKPGAHRWPVCATCWPLTVKASTTLVDDLGLSEHLTGAAFGVQPSMGRSWVKPFATLHADADPATVEGLLTPFGFVSEKHKREAARRWPKYAAVAPDDIRQRLELERRAENAQAAMDAATRPAPTAVTFDTDETRPTARSW